MIKCPVFSYKPQMLTIHLIVSKGISIFLVSLHWVHRMDYIFFFSSVDFHSVMMSHRHFTPFFTIIWRRKKKTINSCEFLENPSIRRTGSNAKIDIRHSLTESSNLFSFYTFQKMIQPKWRTLQATTKPNIRLYLE